MEPARHNRWLAFSLAVCVTSSVMFFTVSAAAAQESLPAPPAGVILDPLAAPVAPVPVPVPVPVDGNVDDQLLPPDEVLHNRNHEIVMDPSGGFSGQLSTATDVDGNLVPAIGLAVRVIQDGATVATATTDATGTFSMTGLNEGVVAILAYNDAHLLLYSLRLVASPNDEVTDQKPSEQNEVETEVATPVKLVAAAADLALQSTVVSARDVATVRQLIFSELPVRDLRFNGSPTEIERTYPFGTQQKSTSLDYHRVELQADGTLKGQVNLLDERTGRHREIMDLMLHFVRNGQHVGATKVQMNGRFEIAGLIPGIYGIATTGTDGILAMGLEIVAPATDVAATKSKFQLASVAQQLNLVIAPANVKNFNRNNVQQHPGLTSPGGVGGAVPMAGAPPFGGPAGGPMGGAPGGFGGGLGGGGAGVGGGGGLGALLAGAAAGALGYALGQDDDETPASPAR